MKYQSHGSVKSMLSEILCVALRSHGVDGVEHDLLTLYRSGFRQSLSLAEEGNVGSLLNMHTRHIKGATCTGSAQYCSVKGIVGQVFSLYLLLS